MAVAGAREHHQMSVDRRTSERQQERGEQITVYGSAKKVEQIRDAGYDRVAASELIERLQTAAAAEAEPAAKLRNLMEAVGHADIRITRSDLENVGLIRFGEGNMEQERFALDLELAKAKVELSRMLASADDAALHDANIVSRDLKEAINGYAQNLNVLLNEHMTERDEAFKKLQRNETLKKALLAGVLGATITLGAQEAVAHFQDSTQGLFESASPTTERQTTLEGVVNHFRDHTTTTASGAEHTMNIAGQSAKVTLPQGFNLTEHAGNWQLTDAHHHVLGNISVDAHGNLTGASQHLLAEHGMSAQIHTEALHNAAVEHITHTPDDYIKAHPHEFTHVHHLEFEDNNTPNKFDLNELREQWGGISGKGIDADGNYVIDMSHMTANGSFHGHDMQNVQELLRQHKLVAVLQGKEGQPSTVIRFDSHGKAVFDKNSFAGQTSFGVDAEGHAVFNGHTLTVSEDMGTRPDGSMNLRTFATVVGHNHLHDYIETIHHPTSQLTIDVTQTVTDATPPTEIPIPIPLYGRGMDRPLAEEAEEPEAAPPTQPIPAPITPPEHLGEELDRSPAIYRRSWETRRSRRQAGLRELPRGTGTEVEPYIERENLTPVQARAERLDGRRAIAPHRLSLTGPERLVRQFGTAQAPSLQGTSAPLALGAPSSRTQEDLASIFETSQRNAQEALAHWEEFRLQTNFDNGRQVDAFIHQTEETINDIFRFYMQFEVAENGDASIDAAGNPVLGLRTNVLATLSRLGLRGRFEDGRYRIYDARRFVAANQTRYRPE